jgi:hypothetical protein
MITRHDVAVKLTEHIRHRLSLNELVAWAEEAMMEAEFDEKDTEVLRRVIARLGLADVREFGLSWEDLEQFLSMLGYRARVEISRVA